MDTKLKTCLIGASSARPFLGMIKGGVAGWGSQAMEVDGGQGVGDIGSTIAD